ncbi:MAG: alpha/beta fold hydrolase [Vulcanimicrobiaceae bacterium]
MRITVDDGTLDVGSEGAGDAIILLHGFPLTREIWASQVPALAARMRVISPDLRGMGSSSVSDGPYLMESLAGDVAAVLDQLKIDRATLVGHSLGGYVAMAFCRMYSERVDRLALVCSRLGADSAKTAASREELAQSAEREGSVDPIVDAYLPRLFGEESIGRDSAAFKRAREIARKNDPRGCAAMLRGMAQRVASEDIAEELTMPVLIIAGALDRIVPLEEARAMTGVFPNARLEVMERSGHLPMLEEPELLARVLAEFAAT